MKPSFKSSIPFHLRHQESTRVLSTYPDRIPVICEKSLLTTIDIDKHKFLVPRNFTVGQFIFVIRQRMLLSPDIALFLFTNGNIPSSSSFLIHVYDTFKDTDGFLYFTFSFENSFG